MTGQTLYLCEKPSQAKDIARVMGLSQRGQGYISGPGTTVTWAVGHLLENAPPDAYGEQYGSPWKAESLPVLPPCWKMVVKKDTADQFAVINKLLKQVDAVVIATDADREGEVIARELLDHCQFTGGVKRLWLSALDEASVRRALDNLLPGDETALLYQAGLGRSQADWLVGMNMTRLYTVKARELGFGDVLSVGRVQTPTLALVVRRDNEIANFVPTPFWQVLAQLEKNGVRFRAAWVPAASYCDDEKRCVQQAVAQAVEQLCRQTGSAVVTGVVTKRDKTPAPLGFDLGTLQEVCSRKWGMGANQVLGIAQALYETHKATTYPRTDCGYLPVSMREEVPAVMAALVKTDPAIAPILATLDRAFVSRIWNDKKITAHHAIIPTRQACDMAALSEDEQKVYQLIRQHYLAQFLPLQETDITDATFNIGGQLFRTRGRVAVVPGWRALFAADKTPPDDTPDNGEDENSPLPPLSQTDVCRVSGAEVKAQQTRPPQPFTEGTLIAAMKNAASYVTDPQLKKVLRDNAGLGTEATRANLLETLFKREYLMKKGKMVISTPLARELIAALPETLTSPGMTALWEQSLDDIAQGRMTLAAFMQKQVQWTLHLVERGRTQTISLTPPVTPPCPVCGGITRKRQGKQGVFYSCTRYPECKGMANVPGSKPRGKGKGRKNAPAS
ncbi:DNA topoisomerase III [Cedecea sp. NFIX57]|uniref:DNA topoisomerase III n=1 Tax=Cedecea sp. NFIX57 TaxID=1566286 RepID=UPI000A09DD44|nr:DNA topoisomerase III [Cedecea sp. NFIX57]SMG55341.1 DNA topoisomerase-3 [Cedecea sp. NFIX57]